jgi:hypothetical protein
VAGALVCARQRPPQFPLRPYNERQDGLAGLAEPEDSARENRVLELEGRQRGADNLRVQQLNLP